MRTQIATQLLAAMASCLTLAACSDDAGTTASGPGPLRPVFSFAILTDSHITQSPENEQRLEAAIAWVNANAAERDVQLVLVLGDIGWGEGLPRAKQLLDALAVPYVPLHGDNEIHEGDDERFETVFAPQLDLLAGTLDDFRKAPSHAVDPSTQAEGWYQNFAFSFHGVRFFALDVCARGQDDIMGEFGVLNDFEGGTWPWFQGELSRLPAGPDDSVIMLSHIPMYLGALDAIEMAAVDELLMPREREVYGNFAGHLHFNYDKHANSYEVFVTDATWDDDNTVRVVSVKGNGERFAYKHELVPVGATAER